MAFIETIPVDQVTGDVRQLYESNQATMGYVPNYAKLFSHRPRVMMAWNGLLGTMRMNMDLCICLARD